MSSYQPNIPTGFVNLDVDYQNIRGNFQQLDTSFGIDHLPFSNATAQNGFHTVVHLLVNSTLAGNPPNNYPIVPPAPVGLTGELFTTQSNDGINADDMLWFQTGSARLMQLTSNFVPIATATGASFLAGGIILQWGTQVLPGTPSPTGTISFNVKTKNVFSIQTTLIGNSSQVNLVSIISATPGSPGSFDWHFTGSASYTAFYWMAITN